MFSKLALFSILAAATAVFANDCNTGTISCCSSTEQSDTPAASTLLDTLGVAVQGVAVPIGLGCSPISVSWDDCTF